MPRPTLGEPPAGLVAAPGLLSLAPGVVNGGGEGAVTMSGLAALVVIVTARHFIEDDVIVRLPSRIWRARRPRSYEGDDRGSDVVWFKVCPALLTGTAALLVAASLL